MSTLLGLLGVDETAVENASASVSGELKLLTSGFYEGKIVKAGFFTNKFKTKEFFVEVEVNGETYEVSDALKTKDNKDAGYVLARVAEIAKAAEMDLGDEEPETTKKKIKNKYGNDIALVEFNAMAGTTLGVISILSYNEDDDFQFREGFTFCQADGTNAKDEDLLEPLNKKIEEMEEFQGYKATKRRAKKGKSKSKSNDGEASETTKSSAAKI